MKLINHSEATQNPKFLLMPLLSANAYFRKDAFHWNFVAVVQRCVYIHNALTLGRYSLFERYSVFAIYANLHSICVESVVQEISIQLS